jgi:SAM-dependent methyltransferase
MTGFSADWLALREPADHHARDGELLRRLAAWVASRDRLTILDLGCGTGSNARALTPHLAAIQHWRLADHDSGLLEIARKRLTTESPDQQRTVTVSTEVVDLSNGIEPLLAADCDLVTASALFDLVSKRWLDSMVAALARNSLPLYTVLTYDGTMEWDPPHSTDAAIREAFNAHQLRDKGFGPSAGPDAGPYLAAKLRDAGYEVSVAPSPWLIGAGESKLMIANALGIAKAVRETGQLSEAELASWVAFRRDGKGCTLGHVDILALPSA